MRSSLGSTKNPEWEEGEPEQDVQNSDGGERQSLGPEPENGEGPGDVGDSAREIRKGQQRTLGRLTRSFTRSSRRCRTSWKSKRGPEICGNCSAGSS